MGLRTAAEAWFARGIARKSPWSEVNGRVNDWASRSPHLGESEHVIMIALRSERCLGRTKFLTDGLQASLSVLKAISQLERNGALFAVSGGVRANELDTAAIVREAIYRKLTDAPIC